MYNDKEYFEKYLDEKFGNLNKRMDDEFGSLNKRMGGFQIILTGQSGSNGLVGTAKEHKLYFKIIALVGGVLVMSYLVPLSYSILEKKLTTPAIAGVNP